MTGTISHLMERVARGEQSNELDVLIEVALFRPDSIYRAVRPNAAGTKLIYTNLAGRESTHLADDWTMRREQTLLRLRNEIGAGA